MLAILAFEAKSFDMVLSVILASDDRGIQNETIKVSLDL